MKLGAIVVQILRAFIKMKISESQNSNDDETEEIHIFDSNGRLIESEDELNDDCPCAGEGRPRIEPGQYIAHCFKANIINYKGAKKYMIWFRLCGGKYDGLELFLPCPDTKGKGVIRTKYYENWVIANGSRPKKGQQMAKSIFKNKEFRISVGDTKRKFENGELKPESLQYSIVKEIKELLDDKLICYNESQSSNDS